MVHVPARRHRRRARADRPRSASASSSSSSSPTSSTSTSTPPTSPARSSPLDRMDPPESWRWGGPAWEAQAPAETGPGRVTGATLTARRSRDPREHLGRGARRRAATGGSLSTAASCASSPATATASPRSTSKGSTPTSTSAASRSPRANGHRLRKDGQPARVRAAIENLGQHVEQITRDRDAVAAGRVGGDVDVVGRTAVPRADAGTRTRNPVITRDLRASRRVPRGRQSRKDADRRWTGPPPRKEERGPSQPHGGAARRSWRRARLLGHSRRGDGPSSSPSSQSIPSSSISPLGLKASPHRGLDQALRFGGAHPSPKRSESRRKSSAGARVIALTRSLIAA